MLSFICCCFCYRHNNWFEWFVTPPMSPVRWKMMMMMTTLTIRRPSTRSCRILTPGLFVYPCLNCSSCSNRQRIMLWVYVTTDQSKKPLVCKEKQIVLYLCQPKLKSACQKHWVLDLFFCYKLFSKIFLQYHTYSGEIWYAWTYVDSQAYISCSFCKRDVSGLAKKWRKSVLDDCSVTLRTETSLSFPHHLHSLCLSCRRTLFKLHCKAQTFLKRWVFSGCI